jgi:hypothetical protein
MNVRTIIRALQPSQKIVAQFFIPAPSPATIGKTSRVDQKWEETGAGIRLNFSGKGQMM